MSYAINLKLIGSLLYLSTNTRPDIAFPVNVLSRFQERPTKWVALKRILRYLKRTITIGLMYFRNESDVLRAYTDVNFATVGLDRKSMTGCNELYGNTVGWGARKQNIVALSFTEVEYVTLSSAISECLGIMQVLESLGLKTVCVVYGDNECAIHISRAVENTKRTKHIDVRYHFIRNYIEKGVIQVKYINMKEQKADLLTKFLPKQNFRYLRDLLKLSL